MLEVEQILILRGGDHRAGGIHKPAVMKLVVSENHEHAARGEQSLGLLSQALARPGVAGFGWYNGDRQVDRSPDTRFVYGPSLVCVEHTVKQS